MRYKAAVKMGCFQFRFRIFFLPLFVKSTLSCLDDKCRELEFPSYYFFYGERFINHVIRTIKVLDQDSCELQCYLEHNCVSINFGFTKTHNCDLNNSTHKEHEKDLVKTEGYVYHGTNNACGEKLCQNNSTCQAGFTSKRYRCLCTSGFTGQDCEQDIDECREETHDCGANAICNNTKGSYNCTCTAGYSGDGQICTAVCPEPENPCQNGGQCERTEDGYLCKCAVGFVGKICENVFELNSTILLKNESFPSHLHRFLAPAVGNDSQWVLCYRASLHGWDASSFHQQCDGKTDTVTIIEKDQYVFGGYTDTPWADCPPGARTKDAHGRCCEFPFQYNGKIYHSCTTAGFMDHKLWCSFDAVYKNNWADCDTAPSVGYRSSTEAFIFSLSNNEGLEPFKAMVKDQSRAIYTDLSFGPTFGEGKDIYIASKASENYGSYTNFGVSYHVPDRVKDKQTILAGTYHFLLNEVEVFYLI